MIYTNGTIVQYYSTASKAFLYSNKASVRTIATYLVHLPYRTVVEKNTTPVFAIVQCTVPSTVTILYGTVVDA